MKNLLIAILLTFALRSVGQPNEKDFQVSYKGKVIGVVKAVEETTGSNAHRELKTTTHTKVLLIITLHVESEIDALYERGSLVNGVAYRQANRGSENILSKITKIADKKYRVVRNKKLTTIQGKRIDYCVVDLYFREPIDRTLVFSIMYGQFIRIKWIGQGKYKVTSPDKKASIYSYKNGRLITIEVETPLGTVVITKK